MADPSLAVGPQAAPPVVSTGPAGSHHVLTVHGAGTTACFTGVPVEPAQRDVVAIVLEESR
ncbi:MAG: hypothetical protein IT336_02140 [Thermomicrobiales bacterium]|nr:hypothetical protein [Thermomicrobiales bacterium]